MLYNNIFKQYNIARDPPKQRRRRNKPKKRWAFSRGEESLIDNSSEEENVPTTYQLVQMRRSFEIPLQNITIRKQGQQQSPSQRQHNDNVHLPESFNTAPTPPDDDDDVDMMPRPIIIKQEPSEEIELSWRSSTVSTIASKSSRISIFKSKLNASLDSGLRNARLRRALASSNSSLNSIAHIKPAARKSPARFQALNITVAKKSSSTPRRSPRNAAKQKKTNIASPKCRRNLSRSWLESDGECDMSSMADKSASRFQPLDITITKKTTPRRSPRNAKKQGTVVDTPQCRRNLNTAWLLDEDPFAASRPDIGEQSFACSSPKESQIIHTPSSTTSPRKAPPAELDLMIELIEKENAAKVAKIKMSPRKSKKRCLPGGYVEMYERALAKARADGKFLKHDKKLASLQGDILKILHLKASHGVYAAKVQRESGRNRRGFWIVLPGDMAAEIKSDSRLEAFFDATMQPYQLDDGKGKALDVYIKPYKLILL